MSTISIAENAGERGSAVRDDRVFPETRVLAVAIPPFLLAAFIMLYFWPGDTAFHFAWTITPNITPMIMGAGYIAGGYFFVRAINIRKWHHITRGFLPVTAFTWFMMIATLLHLDKFNHSHVSFWAWLGLYILSPFIVPLVWLRNRVTDPGVPDPNDVIVPDTMRRIVGAVGAGILAVGLVMLILPEFMQSIWPWSLTPLTARVIAGWFALPGVAGLVLAGDSRWSAWRIPLQSQLFGIGLILLAVPLSWGDFRADNPMTWAFIGGMALLLGGLGAIYLAMEARYRKVSSKEV